MITTLLLSRKNNGRKQAGILRVLCLAILNLMVAFSVQAQTPVVATIPPNTASSNFSTGEGFIETSPFGNIFRFQYTTFIYTNSEIKAAYNTTSGNTLTTGTITHLAFFAEALNNPQPVNVEISLKLTTESSFQRDQDPGEDFQSAQTFSTLTAGSTTVYTNPTFNVTSTGWVTIDITDFPIDLTDPTQNLQVTVKTSCAANNCPTAGQGSESNTFPDAKQFEFYDAVSDRFIFFSGATDPSGSQGEVYPYNPDIQLTIVPTTTPPPPTCAAPTITSANGSTSGNAVINFTAPAGTTELQYTTDQTFTTGVFSSSPVTSPETLSGLNVGTYYVRLRTTCTNNVVSSFSAVDTFIIAAAPTPQTCEAPTNISAVSNSPNTITVSYTPSGGLTGSYSFTYGTTGPIALTTNPQTITGVPAGSYAYSITKDCGGSTATANSTSNVVVSDPAQTCEAPTNISAVSNSPNTITVSYTPSGGLTGSYSFTYGTTGPIALTTNPQTITGVPAGSYAYSITKDCGGSTATANSTSNVVVSDPAPTCAAATGLFADMITQTSARINFTINSPGDTYTIEWGPVGFVPNTGANTGSLTSITSSPQTISGLTAGTAYDYYVIRQCNTTFTTSAKGNFTTLNPAGVCDAPTNLTATTLTTTSAQVNFTMNGNTAGDFYIVELEEFNGTTWDPVNSQNVTTTPVTYNGLDPDTEYRVFVTKNCFNAGNLSTRVGPATFSTNCASPTNVAVVSNSPNTLTVSYTASTTGAPGTYSFTYTPNGGSPTTITLTNNPQTITGVPAGTYSFSLAKDCNGTPSTAATGNGIVVSDPAVCEGPTSATVTGGTNELTVSYTPNNTGAAGNYFFTYTPAVGSPTTVALSTNPQTITGVPAGTYSYTVYKDCNGTQSTVTQTGSGVIVIGAPVACSNGTWLGITSSDWHTASNWCNNMVPDINTDVRIPANTALNPVLNYPVISADAFTRNLLIEANATLTLASGLLTVSGIYSNQGTLIDNGDGSLAFTGSSPQTLGKPGQTLIFLNLTVGPGGVTQGGPIRVKRMLTLNGNLTTLGNELTLLADQTLQAMVVNNGSAAVIGTATFEKYIDPTSPGFAGQGYRHLTSPVSNAMISQIHDDFPIITNPDYNTNPATANPFPTIFRYDETRVTPANPTFDAGWVSPNDLNEPMAPAVRLHGKYAAC